MKKALLIVNPKSGKQAAKPNFFDIVNNLSLKYEVTVHITKSTEDLIETAKTAEFTHVIACGGDGTLSGTVSGILENPLRDKIRLGYIPAGTANDVASTLEIPKSPAAAALYVVRNAAKPHDVGRLCDRSFVYTASFGTFTRVSYETSQDAKNLLGNFAYLLNGAQDLIRLKGYDITVEYDGKVMEKKDITFCSISNTYYLGGGLIRLSPDFVKLDDGKLELLTVSRPKNLFDLENIVRLIAQRDFNNEFITLVQAKDIRITAETPLAFTLDGESGGDYTDVTVSCLPHAVNLIKS